MSLGYRSARTHRDCAITCVACFILARICGNLCLTKTRSIILLTIIIVNDHIFFRYIQKSIIQASYWHDPLKEDEYKKKNIFLADINNENTINTVYIINNYIIKIFLFSLSVIMDSYTQEYKNNLQNLRTLVLVKFDNDTMVEPVESEWFGFYKPGQTEEIQQLQETELYQQVHNHTTDLDAR